MADVRSRRKLIDSLSWFSGAAWLDLAHKKLDAAVAAAYGWPADLSDERILENLLALNLERAAEEAKAERVKKPKVTREKRADELL